MGGHMILLLFCCGCAALALWTLARFPALGPRRPVAVILAVLAVAVGLPLGASVFAAVADLGRFGVLAALLVVVAPVLTASFWVSGCVLRALAETPGLRG